MGVNGKPLRFDRQTIFKQDSRQYEAILRLVDRGEYESPAHAIRRAVTMLLAFHGERIEDRDEVAA